MDAETRRGLYKLNSEINGIDDELLKRLYLEEILTSACSDEEFACYDGAIKDKWFKFWWQKGDEIAKYTWIVKYKHFLEPAYFEKLEDAFQIAVSKTDENESGLILECACPQKCLCKLIYLYKLLNILCERYLLETPDETNDWDNLFCQHYAAQYEVNYKIFLELYYKIQEQFNTEKDEEESTYNVIECTYSSDSSEYYLVDEDEDMLAMGLPTSFGKCKKRERKVSADSENKYETYIKAAVPVKEKVNVVEAAPIETMLSGNNSAEDGSGEKVQDIRSKTSKKKKKTKKTKKLRKILPQEILEDKALLKYWKRRFLLFSKFDEGIRLDRESWFSVTPEKIAKHLAQRLKCSLIVDAFCGSGGNAIQFAFTCQKIIAIDIDPAKIEIAKHNARIYGVEKKIEFIVGDFLHLCKYLKADVIFLSPPWGGPSYIKSDTYDIENDLEPISASKLLSLCREVTENIAIYLPRNCKIQQLSKTGGKNGKVETERSFLGDKCVAITAYYGDLISPENADVKNVSDVGGE